MRPPFRRFVALGDSQTEGVGDELNPDGTPRGWADRFATDLTRETDGFRYANLAIRGRRVADVRAEQLPAALALRPDLASVVAGINDVIRPRCSLGAVVADLDAIQDELTGAGALVISATFPDLSRISPAARLVRERIASLNDAVRELAERHGALLVDVAQWPQASTPEMWCRDRLHLSPHGHARLAHAVYARLRGEAPVFPESARVEYRLRLDRELAWAARYLGPWILRRLTGRSSGDGRTAKRPEPLPIAATSRAEEATH
jgi:lysophospholipase L1-like esterase